MKKIVSIITGVILFILSIFGADSFLDSAIKGNREVIRNYRSYERFWSTDVAKLVMDENTLPIFGSSELVSLEDYNDNISSFLNSKDMNIMTMGAGYFQSLSHTMTLGAISDNITSKTVALFVSPQWFAEGGISTEAFPARFSEDELLGFLGNSSISHENKEYVISRTEQLLAGSPTQLNRVQKYASSIDGKFGLNNVYTDIMENFWELRAKFDVYKQIGDMQQNVPSVNLADLDWDNMYRLAERQGEAACTNNDFGINDDYWNKYVKEIYEQGEVVDKQQIYEQSVEYDDLKCFLNVARELNIEVLLVSIPVNEKWYSYQGMLCDNYYEKIRDIAVDYTNVKLVDMTKYANEKYFFKDVMHLGWKGWTRVNEALYKEFVKQ